MNRALIRDNLLAACVDGEQDFVQHNVQQHQTKEDYEVYDERRSGPLHRAVFGGNPECVRTLLTVASINVRHQDKFGRTALFLAHLLAQHVSIIEMLTDFDVGLIEIPDNDKAYPMHMAIEYEGGLSGVRAMVESCQRQAYTIIDRENNKEYT